MRMPSPGEFLHEEAQQKAEALDLKWGSVVEFGMWIDGGRKMPAGTPALLGYPLGAKIERNVITIMAMLMDHATMLNPSLFTYSPMSSLRLISRRMKISTTGSQTPLATCERSRILNSGAFGNQDDAGARLRSALCRDRRIPALRFKLAIDARLEAQAFADHVSRRERKNRRGEERRVQQAEREKISGPASGKRDQRLGGLRGVGDVGHAVGVERGRACKR